MPLAHLHVPFDHPDWIFEVKYDGWRALAYIDNGKCQLVSRKGNVLKSFPDLCRSMAREISGQAVLDGEIVYLGPDGKPEFFNLMRRRAPQYFCAFDLLWRNGKDYRSRPLLKRKAALEDLIRPPVLAVEHIAKRGVDLFSAVCEQDLEGIVAKLANGRYEPDRTTWVKIKNKKYSQAVGRHEFFNPSRQAASSANLPATSL